MCLLSIGAFTQLIKTMRCFPKTTAKNAESLNKEGYLDEIEKRNQSTNDEQYCLSEEDFLEIRRTFKKDKMKMPPASVMLKNLLNAGKDEISAIIEKKEPVTNEEIARRLSVCALCEFYTPNIAELSEDQKAQNRCVKCGCYMSLKSRLRSADCPVGTW